MYTNEEECVIRNLFEEVPDEEVTELGCDSDTWSDHQSESDHFRPIHAFISASVVLLT
jgi:hypothetical protein